MKSVWSKTWKASTQPRKQRKYVYNAAYHIRHRFLAAHLSKDLRTKYGKRSFPLRSGDKVKIMRGTYKNQTGKIDRVSMKETKVFISGIDITKKDGSKQLVAFKPSNLMITELNLSDKKRENSLLRQKKEK